MFDIRKVNSLCRCLVILLLAVFVQYWCVTDRQIVRQDDHIYRASIALAGNENYTPLTTQFVQPNCIVFKYCFTIIIEDDKQ